MVTLLGRYVIIGIEYMSPTPLVGLDPATHSSVLSSTDVTWKVAESQARGPVLTMPHVLLEYPVSCQPEVLLSVISK